MKNSHGLNNSELAIVKAILAPFREKIGKVGLFGSRATGAYRKNSDIDLVVYGAISEAEIRELWTLFDNSNLAYKVDVIAYDLIASPELRNHIDNFVKPLFSQLDLQKSETIKEKEKI